MKFIESCWGCCHSFQSWILPDGTVSYWQQTVRVGYSLTSSGSSWNFQTSAFIACLCQNGFFYGFLKWLLNEMFVAENEREWWGYIFLTSSSGGLREFVFEVLKSWLVSTVLFLFCFEVYFGISVCMHSGLLNFLVFLWTWRFIDFLSVCGRESLLGFKIFCCFLKFWVMFSWKFTSEFEIQEWLSSLFFDFLSATSGIFVSVCVYKLLGFLNFLCYITKFELGEIYLWNLISAFLKYWLLSVDLGRNTVFKFCFGTIRGVLPLGFNVVCCLLSLFVKERHVLMIFSSKKGEFFICQFLIFIYMLLLLDLGMLVLYVSFVKFNFHTRLVRNFEKKRKREKKKKFHLIQKKNLHSSYIVFILLHGYE